MCRTDIFHNIVILSHMQVVFISIGYMPFCKAHTQTTDIFVKLSQSALIGMRDNSKLPNVHFAICIIAMAYDNFMILFFQKITKSPSFRSPQTAESRLETWLLNTCDMLNVIKCGKYSSAQKTPSQTASNPKLPNTQKNMPKCPS